MTWCLETIDRTQPEIDEIDYYREAPPDDIKENLQTVSEAPRYRNGKSVMVGDIVIFDHGFRGMITGWNKFGQVIVQFGYGRIKGYMTTRSARTVYPVNRWYH